MLKKDNWDAKFYKNHSQGQFALAMNIIKTINFEGNEHVLDIGCGDGKITAEIAKIITEGSVLGIDVSENMISEAISSFKEYRNLEFKNCDATKFNLPKQFDLIVSFSAIHWVEDQQKVFNNIFAHLKEGGKLLMTMSAPIKTPVSKLFQSSKWTNLPRNYFPQTIENLSKILIKSGFKFFDIDLKTSSRKFESKQELFNYAFAWVPQSTGFEKDRSIEFANDIVDAVSNSRNDGKLILDSARLIINAKK